MRGPECFVAAEAALWFHTIWIALRLLNAVVVWESLHTLLRHEAHSRCVWLLASMDAELRRPFICFTGKMSLLIAALLFRYHFWGSLLCYECIYYMFMQSRPQKANQNERNAHSCLLIHGAVLLNVVFIQLSFTVPSWGPILQQVRYTSVAPLVACCVLKLS